jgi:hypothetical protein
MRRTLLALSLLLLVATPGSARNTVDALVVHGAPLPLDTNDAARTTVGRLVYRGGLILEAQDRRFGGWSDLSVSPDGTRLTAISDEGYWLTAGLSYSASGNITALTGARIGPLVDFSGRPLEDKPFSDAEGLAAYPDGSFLVSFERRHRLWLYPAADPPFSIPPRAVPIPPRLSKAPPNGGMEALVRLTGGRLFGLTEELMDHGDHVGWIGDGLIWEELHYRAAADFKPVGAAEFPPGTFAAGDVLVVERRFTLLDGPGSRIVRLKRGDIKAGARLEGEEIARILPPLTIDNFEGIAIVRGENGAARIYLLSDNNYSILQRTLLLQFELKPYDK